VALRGERHLARREDVANEVSPGEEGDAEDGGGSDREEDRRLTESFEHSSSYRLRAG
jgi:hypothetical protein